MIFPKKKDFLLFFTFFVGKSFHLLLPRSLKAHPFCPTYFLTVCMQIKKNIILKIFIYDLDKYYDWNASCQIGVNTRLLAFVLPEKKNTIGDIVC